MERQLRFLVMENQFAKVLFVYLLFQILIFQERSSVSAEYVLVADDAHWIVQTSSGLIEGSSTTGFTEREVYSFYGIPYAEPPVGPLRFQPPQPIKPWTDTLKANKKPLPCYQQKMKYSWLVIRNESKQIQRPWSEDCLTLNIWVPKPRIQEAPVLVVFHPGTFGQGSNTYPDGSTLSGYAQDVVVSMNYRLGAFGFLYLGVPGAPGNMGLLDQQLALKWIHKNIHNFGGNTQAIILFGAGNAGSASTGYHLLSQGSANIFKTIAPFSGSPICPWAFQDTERSLKNAITLSSRLGCNEEEPDLECLRSAHPEDIVDASSIDLENTLLDFLPTVDGTFLTENPVEALKAGKFNKANVLSVSTANEGSLPFEMANRDIFQNLEEGIDLDVFRKTVQKLHPTLSDTAIKAVEDYYIGKCNFDDRLKIRDAAIRVYSDLLIDCCMNKFDEYLAEKDVIIFRVNEDFEKQSNPSWVKASHAINVEYCFGYPLIDDGYGPEEKKISYLAADWIHQQTWKKASEMKEHLHSFDLKDKNYTVWDKEGPKHLSHYREDQCKFWNEIVPKLEKSNEKCT